MGLWGLGLVAVLADCGTSGASRPPPRSPAPLDRLSRHRPGPGINPGSASKATFPPPHPGPATVSYAGPAGSRHIALTIDDGFDPATVSAYVEFARRTGTHLTFSPNGRYADVWARHAPVLRPLIAAGRVQIGNHSYSHRDLRRLPDAVVREEIERNEAWIQLTFGTTSRPWFRPPYGSRDARTDELAGATGFTRVLMWNGSFGDSRLLTPDVLLTQARRYLQPGTVMLGHANHLTITRLFDAVLELLRERDLRPVTLDEMFGTSRRIG